MSGNKKNKQKWILLLILFLVVGIAATTIIYMDRIREFLPNDEGAIELTDTEDDETIVNKDDEEKTDSEAKRESVADVSSEMNTDNSNAQIQHTGTTYHPESEVSDQEQIWGKTTDIEIFKISYANGQQEITVKSSNGEKVVAPGTENSYTFKLKNSGDVALDYEVDMDLFTNLSETEIPLECRVHRYDGTWIAGDKNKWVSIAEVKDILDKYTVGAGRYTTYTLDWRWPFETGNDEADTILGSTAVEKDLVFTLVIETRAEISEDVNATPGIIPVTGDNSNVGLYTVLMIGSVLMILILLWFRERDEETSYE